MQTAIFIGHLKEIIQKLKVDELITELKFFTDHTNNSPVLPEKKKRFSDLVFRSATGFSILSQEKEKEDLLQAFSIPSLYDSQRLSQMMTSVDSASATSHIFNNPTSFIIFRAFLATLQSLYAAWQTLDSCLLQPRHLSVGMNNDVTEIEVFDYHNQGIEPERLILILTSFQKLHDSIARIVGENDAQLKLTFADSGSNFLIGLASRFKVIEFTKRLFSQYWRQVWFSPYEEFDRKVESVKNGLDAIKAIRQNVEGQALDEENGRILEHSLLSEMKTLIRNGAAPKELERIDTVERQQFLLEHRDVKLLAQSQPDKGES